MSLPKNYHSMKPSDKIAAQQSVYREQQKMYTMGSEKPVYIPGRSKFLWKEPVMTMADLPARPVSLEARYVLKDDAAFFWLDGRWQKMVTQQALKVEPKEPSENQQKYDALKGLLEHKLQPEKMIMSEDTFNALVEFSEWAEIQDELLPSMEEDEPDWFMDAFDVKDVDL